MHGHRDKLLTRADKNVIEALSPTGIGGDLIRFDGVPDRHNDGVEGVPGVNLEDGRVVSLWGKGRYVQVTAGL